MKSISYHLRACCAIALLMSSAASAQDFQAEFDSQWGLRMIGVDKALKKGLDGKGVRVGVADTGLQIGDKLHPELVGRFRGLGIDGFGGSLDDDNGHGTHVAGIIAGNRDGEGMMGVASGAEIVAMRVLLDGASLEEQQVAAETAYRYALKQGVRIFNASYGYPGPFTDYSPEMIESFAARELNVYREVVNAGGVMVVAAGNDGWAEPSVPGALPIFFPELQRGWMTVAAVNPEGELAWYSQGCGGGSKYFCISAPGGDEFYGEEGLINSTWLDGTYLGEQGTSMAAPHVTGALAIAKQLYPNASEQELAQLVFQTATDIGDAGLDDIYGWGLLNVGNLVTTNEAEAGAIYAQAAWSHATTVNRIADVIESHPAQAETDGYGLWLTPFASRASLSLGSAGLSGDYTTGGLIGGIDYALDDRWTVGAAVGFSQNRFTADNGNRVEDTSYHAAPYIAFDDDTFFANATLGTSFFSGKTRRVRAPGMDDTILALAGLDIAGDQSDRALWATTRIGSHFAFDDLKLSPYVFSRMVRQHLGGVNETGTSVLVLNAASATATTGEVGVGMKVSTAPVVLSGIDVTPSLNIAYGRSFGDFKRTLELMGSPIVSKINPDKNRVALETDLLFARSASALEGKLSYRASVNSDTVSHTIAANLSLKF
ncbi:S8 family serine peptidase [Shinella sp. M27]|uniref:S8 family serine peptidase n=1 Tax=Shinella sp. M27 TaxID=3368614 RepID=UPI003BA211DC